jgi:hypothetical protein
MEGKALAGVRPCGCVTAALSIKGPEDWCHATEKDVREFYASMCASGREVRYMDIEDLRAALTMECQHRESAA